MIDLNSQAFRDQVYGCWMGKNCGGTLGAPLERALGEPEPFDVWWYPELKEGGIPNDDLEMQLIWLKALEEVGPHLKAADLAQYWLDHIGYNWDEYGLSKTNLRLGLLPPVAGAYNNWFKDCMGCPIRSEIWACVAPGAPRIAVRYAYEDAICDHAGGESVFGELFNTAVEAAAFVVSDREQLIDIGMSYIPAWSKTAQAITAARAAHAEGVDWKTARKRVLETTPHHVAQYSPINIAFQVIGWLYGEDFGDAICKAVNCGYDTDCTGATLGSVLGIVATRQGLPRRWTEPLGETISTNESWGGLRHASSGPNPVPATLDELTERVCRMAQRVLSAHGVLDGGSTFVADPATLYADEGVRALWTANPMRLDHREGTVQIGVDYGDTPAVVPGTVKSLTIHLTNPHPVELNAQCTLMGPQGWEPGSTAREVSIPPHASATVEWEVPVPEPAVLENTNTLRLLVEVAGRPAQPAAPIVLIGARRFRYAGPYNGDGASDKDLFIEAFEPEQLNGAAATERGGNWTEGYARENAFLLGDVFTTGGALYVQTYLWSPAARDAWIGASANCPTKLWVNGTLAVESFAYRPVRPSYGGNAESYASVPLVDGWNEVLMKFVRIPDAAPFEAHLLVSSADKLHDGLEQIGWTRWPSDVL
ncbi:MAG TPA: ADP-ribosylglycohydrolase family protein [Herpetosiphonaceae bacterium]|nr:ADP-ribosylglycohydrolase family protein [Herpetosiphonaceae bacterium]